MVAAATACRRVVAVRKPLPICFAIGPADRPAPSGHRSAIGQTDLSTCCPVPGGAGGGELLLAAVVLLPPAPLPPPPPACCVGGLGGCVVGTNGVEETGDTLINMLLELDS
jgi:hypothetical protein